MQLSETQTKMLMGVLVVVVIGVVYLLWTRSAPPEPTLAPGQTLSNPLGETRRSPGTQEATSGQGASDIPAKLPPPGTFDAQRGFGPSKGAPIPGSR
jgi:hypothetical protein